MSHVTTETATVYRVASTRKRYFSKRWAYYNAAKAMVSNKYPADEPWNEDYYNEHEDRANKRILLFHEFTGGDIFEPPGDWFDSGKWQLFIERVAKFLKFRDGRQGTCSACDCATLIECKDGGKLIGMGCTECGAMFDVKGKQ